MSASGIYDIICAYFSKGEANGRYGSVGEARQALSCQHGVLVVLAALRIEGVRVESCARADVHLVEEGGAHVHGDGVHLQRVSQEIVSAAYVQLVYQLDLLAARAGSVRVIAHLRLDVVADRPGDGAVLSARGGRVHLPRIDVVVVLPFIAVRILVIKGAVAVGIGAEVRIVGHGYRGGYHVPYGLHLVVLAEIERAVDSGAHGHRAAVILRDSEAGELRAHLRFDLVRLRVEVIIGGTEEPVLPVCHRGREIEVAQKREARQADAEVVRHAVLELVQETFGPEFRRLEVDFVLQGGAVAEGYLLVEALLPDAVLALEGIEGGYAEIEAGE